MARKYEQKRRAEKQAETRQRIVEAAVALHGELGPARTPMSAVAERAGVQRNTLYRHFPDERSLLYACSGHFDQLHPLPDHARWDEIDDPVKRARHGLRELYAYWESTEEMMAKVLRDVEQNEIVSEVGEVRTGVHLRAMQESIVSAWPRGKSRKRLAAAVGLAIHFRTWQSLVRQGGLTSNAAADLMAQTLACVAES